MGAGAFHTSRAQARSTKKESAGDLSVARALHSPFEASAVQRRTVPVSSVTHEPTARSAFDFEA